MDPKLREYSNTVPNYNLFGGICLTRPDFSITIGSKVITSQKSHFLPKTTHFGFQLKNNLYAFVVAANDSMGLENSQERTRVFVRRVGCFASFQAISGDLIVLNRLDWCRNAVRL